MHHWYRYFARLLQEAGNTAKLMAENPMTLRLKELEALEKIADKVRSLTVHNGTRGLLDDLVSLSAETASKRKV